MGVTSVPGRGSTFWIEMPSATPAAAPPEPARVTSRITVASYTVLYIEDNAANLRLIEMILSRQSALRLISATRGDSGLDLARRERPDLILLDINLPGMNGYDVLGALQLDPATRAIPVIALSADAMPIDIERARRAGFADYVTKPVQVSRLLATLETVLASSRPPSHHPR
jgi:CheY-like chemotaxis protein